VDTQGRCISSTHVAPTAICERPGSCTAVLVRHITNHTQREGHPVGVHHAHRQFWCPKICQSVAFDLSLTTCINVCASAGTHARACRFQFLPDRREVLMICHGHVSHLRSPLIHRHTVGTGFRFKSAPSNYHLVLTNCSAQPRRLLGLEYSECV
jgi:hypothetical protein